MSTRVSDIPCHNKSDKLSAPIIGCSEEILRRPRVDSPLRTGLRTPVFTANLVEIRTFNIQVHALDVR